MAIRFRSREHLIVAEVVAKEGNLPPEEEEKRDRCETPGTRRESQHQESRQARTNGEHGEREGVPAGPIE